MQEQSGGYPACSEAWFLSLQQMDSEADLECRIWSMNPKINYVHMCAYVRSRLPVRVCDMYVDYCATLIIIALISNVLIVFILFSGKWSFLCVPWGKQHVPPRSFRRTYGRGMPFVSVAQICQPNVRMINLPQTWWCRPSCRLSLLCNLRFEAEVEQ
jgi:hypothetical protein